VSLLGLLLLGVGAADLLFSALRRPRLAGALAAVLVVVVGLAAGFTDPLRLVLLAVVAAAAVLWAGAVTSGFRQGGDPRLPLALLGAAVLVALTAAGEAPPVAGPLAELLRASPFLPDGLPADRALLVAALVLVQLSTGNVVVRLVLAASGTTNPLRTGGGAASEPSLKGGRLLGPMERLVILGLGLAGEVTAASIVIAAKGLLRFPELQAARAEEAGVPGVARPPGIHEVTEYFLVGSFVSWLVPLASLALLASSAG
jgi:hypothetical protein